MAPARLSDAVTWAGLDLVDSATACAVSFSASPNWRPAKSGASFPWQR
jgi:hypothetical protein